MSDTTPVTIERIQPQGDHPTYTGFTIQGHTSQGRKNVQVYYEIPANGVMSANMPTVSGEDGGWRVMFPGDFAPGTEITAYARSGTAALAQFTKVL